MKVFCKRTYFETNSNFFKIDGKAYGENYTKWRKNNTYHIRKADEWEEKLGIIYYIETEQMLWSPVNQKRFEKYFLDIQTLRDEKIKDLLK